MTDLPKIFGTFVQIEDCAGIAIDAYVSGNVTDQTEVMRQEAFAYGEWCFDTMLLERSIEPND